MRPYDHQWPQQAILALLHSLAQGVQFPLFIGRGKQYGPYLPFSGIRAQGPKVSLISFAMTVYGPGKYSLYPQKTPEGREQSKNIIDTINMAGTQKRELSLM